MYCGIFARSTTNPPAIQAIRRQKRPGENAGNSDKNLFGCAGPLARNHIPCKNSCCLLSDCKAGLCSAQPRTTQPRRQLSVDLPKERVGRAYRTLSKLAAAYEVHRERLHHAGAERHSPTCVKLLYSQVLYIPPAASRGTCVASEGLSDVTERI